MQILSGIGALPAPRPGWKPVQLKPPAERGPCGHEPVVIHPLPEIERMDIHVKILNELPFQSRQTLEGRPPIPVLAHGLDRGLENQGGQAEDLPVLIF
jgi:hypothetical protein